MTTDMHEATAGRIFKLLNLALDRGANDNEAVSAFTQFRRLVLANGLTFDDLFGSDGVVCSTDPWREYPMPFGKHRGMTLGEITAHHPDYIVWLSGRELHEPLATFVYLAWREIVPQTS